MSARHTSAKPARGATMHTSQQSSEVAVTDSEALKLALLAQAPGLVLDFVLAAVAVAAIVDPQL